MRTGGDSSFTHGNHLAELGRTVVACGIAERRPLKTCLFKTSGANESIFDSIAEQPGEMCIRDRLGFDRVHNITKRIRRAGKSPEGIQPAPKSRMRISREQFGAAELEKMSRRESERRMQQEIVYLQQQMAFLKKLMRQPEGADSDTCCLLYTSRCV